MKTLPRLELNFKGARVIARYTRPAMGRIWTEENRYSKWLQVELAATETLADASIVPAASGRRVCFSSGY